MLDTKTMDTTNEINEQDTVSVTIRMEAPIHRAVKGVADREDRSLTKQIERILKKDAEVKKPLEAEAAGVGA